MSTVSALPEVIEIDFRSLLRLILARWWWIALAMIVCGGAFAVAASLMTPVYRATVVMVPAGLERSNMGAMGAALGQLGGLASLAGINAGPVDSETEESLAVLRSRQLTESFISENDLMPILFGDKWDTTQRHWKGAEKDHPTAAQAYRYFNKKIRAIGFDKKTGLVTLQVDWKDRVQAAGWANDLVRRINLEMRERAVAGAEAATGFLMTELVKTQDVGTREAINRLIEVQIKHKMLANVSREYAFRVVDSAMVPDAADPVSPRASFLVLGGCAVGLFLGILLVLAVRLYGLTGVKSNENSIPPSNRRFESQPDIR